MKQTNSKGVRFATALNKALLPHKDEAMESSQEVMRLKLSLSVTLYKMSIILY